MPEYDLPAPSPRARELHDRMVTFMRERVLPAEDEYLAARHAAGPDGHEVPQVVERLKREVAEPRGVPVSQIALAWVLRNPVVSTALVGARTPAEVDQNVAGASLQLGDDEVARIESIMRDAAGTISTFTPFKNAIEEWE